MFNRITTLILLSLTFSLAHAGADNGQALVDIGADVEEITADGDAAVAQAKAANIRNAKEKEENARALREANKARLVAEGRRKEALATLKRAEAEMKPIVAEQTRIKNEMAKMEHDNAVSEKMIQDGTAKLEKLKKEMETVQQLRAEKTAHTTELNKQRDEIVSQVKAVEAQHAQAESDFKQAAEAEKVATAKLEKATTEETQKKNKLQIEIGKLKERYRRAKASTAAMDSEVTKMHQSTAKMEQQLKTGQAELAQAEAENPKKKTDAGDFVSAEASDLAPNRAVTSTQDFTLKRDCNIREAPDREAKFLGVKHGGSQIPKGVDKGGWVAFPINGTQTGYLLKNCF